MRICSYPLFVVFRSRLRVVHLNTQDLAKAMTATHIANIDRLITNTSYAKNLGLNTAGSAGDSGFCGAVGMKYHPGAVAAWEEAGVSIPDCAKP